MDDIFNIKGLLIAHEVSMELHLGSAGESRTKMEFDQYIVNGENGSVYLHMKKLL